MSARLSPTDITRLASRGLRGHLGRFMLSAAGIAIGVAAMIAVAGIAQSSRVQLNDLLSHLGTNFLRVYPAPDLQGRPTRLPGTASTMLSRIGPVTAASGVGTLVASRADGPGPSADLGVYRTDFVPTGHTNGLVVDAVDSSLLATLHGSVDVGHWFTRANTAFPTVVLGADAAARLAIDTPGTRVWIDQRWWVVVGILRPLPLAPALDGAAMIPASAARTYAGFDGTMTSVYLRADEHAIIPVSAVVPVTASPEHPDDVGIDRPTDALTAQLTANDTLNRLLVGLAAVGLLIGGVGISNTMIIAVIERRTEVGLRRALGATRSHIAIQFLAESGLMSATGGVAGVLLGYAVTMAYARIQHWGVSLPLWIGAATVLATAVVGTVAGLSPAIKASRESPTSALSGT